MEEMVCTKYPVSFSKFFKKHPHLNAVTYSNNLHKLAHLSKALLISYKTS